MLYSLVDGSAVWGLQPNVSAAAAKDGGQQPVVQEPSKMIASPVSQTAWKRRWFTRTAGPMSRTIIKSSGAKKVLIT